MPRYEAMIPVYAVVRWVLETTEAVTDEAELKRRMLDEGGPASGRLCHQCADNTQIDDPGVPVEGDFDFDVWEA